MAKGVVLKPIFKSYHQGQMMLLPPSLEDLIAVNHPVRVVNKSFLSNPIKHYQEKTAEQMNLFSG